VPLAFLIIVLVLVDDVASLLEIGMRKKMFINACISNASHRHRTHQNSAVQHQTCEDQWSALLWIRLIILLVNICGNVSLYDDHDKHPIIGFINFFHYVVLGILCSPCQLCSPGYAAVSCRGSYVTASVPG
jgi:hypothetical protein